MKPVEQGDFVEVVKPVSDTEKTLLGRQFRVSRMDKTHGYAVCSDEWGSWHLHPEALKILTQCEPGCPGHEDPFLCGCSPESGR